jgi:hypothetical protein
VCGLPIRRVRPLARLAATGVGNAGPTFRSSEGCRGHRLGPSLEFVAVDTTAPTASITGPTEGFTLARTVVDRLVENAAVRRPYLATNPEPDRTGRTADVGPSRTCRRRNCRVDLNR